MNRSIFGAYDIRGRIPIDFTIQDGLAISRAILSYFRQRNRALTAIVLGRDGRSTSDPLAAQLKKAAAELNVAVHDLGLCSSPQLYHALHTGPITSGIMITASHNPAEYNGFKIRFEREPVWGEQLQEIAAMLSSDKAVCRCFITKRCDACHPEQHGDEVGRHRPGSSYEHPQGATTLQLNNDAPNGTRYLDPSTRLSPSADRRARMTLQTENQAIATHSAATYYTTHLTDLFTLLKNSAIHAIIDSGNGAAGPTAAALIDNLALTNITLINQQPDETFPSHPPDPSKKENLIDLISQVNAAPHPTIGLALDGDGDRLAVILEDGTHLNGDDILALLCRPILKEHPGAHVVCDIKSSSRLTRTVTQHGGHCHFSRCGHPFIQEEMKRHSAILGGEVSGHLFFNDRYFGFDDGMYALLRVLELRQQAGPLVAQFAELPLAYASKEQRITCKNKDMVVQAAQEKAAKISDAQLITTDGIRVELEHGWLLVRAAQTEPVISVRVEGVDQKSLVLLEDQLAQLLELKS